MFTIKSQDGKARTGILKVASGQIKTPFFMPVATKASVKNLTSHDLKDTKTECIIANSYMLSLKPGADLIHKHGGIHKFMKWNKGIFTDSGGFQLVVPSLKPEISDKGVRFRNPFSNQKELFTPEKSMEVQIKINSDVAMTLDHVPYYRKDYEYQKEAVIRTNMWAVRCIKYHQELKDVYKSKQFLFGIAQGGVYTDLRKESAKNISSLEFDGLAYGGLAFGEPPSEMFASVDACNKIYPYEKIKYLMGLGSPIDIINAVERGIDCFDSIYPTKNARRGSLFVNEKGFGTLKIMSGKYKNDESPIQEGCKCYTCKNHSRSYVRHLLEVEENLGLKLATIHNIYFMQNMISEIRKAIDEERFTEFKREWLMGFVKR